MKGRIKCVGSVMREICDRLEPELQKANFLDNAPFETVSVVFRFGEKNGTSTEYATIDKRHGELPVAMELEMDSLRQMSREEVGSVLLDATLGILMKIGCEYDLPLDFLQQFR